ncbi:MAG: L-2-amino-thiazoline-4-carboxylic acid hydrolase [Candidatus Thorarchaeota archaeon]
MEEKQKPGYDRETLLKEFDNLMNIARSVRVSYLDEEGIEQLAQEARVKYNKIIPILPYVGGEKSRFTDLMIQSGMTVAFYKACKDRNLSDRQIGELIYKIVEEEMRSVSRIKKWFARRMLFTSSYRNAWRQALEDSQTREYPKNWVGEFVEGNGIEFEFGFDFLECGFMKLARDNDCEKIVPYACLCDFARMRGLGVGFRRTQTLAMGHPRCDFRFLKDYKTQRGWPPESLDEVRNSQLEDVQI